MGGVAEWLKAHAWKACKRENVSRVRIPLPPYIVRGVFLRFWVAFGEGFEAKERPVATATCGSSWHRAENRG